ncbi:hypothetical protein P885DRAFT_81433 [Corynascus similis CBS 632.67]
MMRLFASSLLLVLAVRADDCQPATWNAKRWEGAYNPKALKRTNGTMSTRTTLMATKYGITVDFFFTLNPTLELDCSNIQPKTEYCVDGFIEPVRAMDQLCGPSNGHATCFGTAYQCCNSETWTCGNST